MLSYPTTTTTTTKRVLVLDDDTSAEEEEEENVQKIKKKKKKKKPFETERMSMKDDDGHCGFGVPGFVEKQPKMVPKQHRELNSIIDNQSVLTATNRRDHFTPFASNLHNKILLKRICIKAGNNARFFLSKTSSSSCIHFSYAPNKNAVLFITHIFPRTLFACLCSNDDDEREKREREYRQQREQERYNKTRECNRPFGTV